MDEMVGIGGGQGADHIAWPHSIFSTHTNHIDHTGSFDDHWRSTDAACPNVTQQDRD
mgnify:CR=1 FL=1